MTTKKPQTHFGRCLLRLRKEQGLSRYRLAQLTGLTDEALRKLELDSVPAWPTVQRIAGALGVPVTTFLDPTENSHENQQPDLTTQTE
jgi:transcriptional regulator with XRE-family HTH domain